MGIDVGSTTVKTVIVEQETNKLLYAKYERHLSDIKQAVTKELKEAHEQFGNIKVTLGVTGSSGLALHEKVHLPFVQEVQAAFLAIKEFYPEVDAAIELGGEDAKIIFVTNGVEERMNGSCAGGTGAFIDQMAALLNVSPYELDQLALKAEKIYPIASRCGVFAKSDIQPLLNQGAKKEDVAMSIFQAVVEQTISGLAQGREIKGNILFLGGPLHFLKALQKAFKDTLHLQDENAIFPKEATIFMALGAALFGEKLKEEIVLKDLIEKIENSDLSSAFLTGKPLFKNEKEYEDFKKNHNFHQENYASLENYKGKAYLGLDSGSTTTKVVLLSENQEILYSHYSLNYGEPLQTLVNQLKEIYKINPDINIVSGAVTGYGEALIQSALKIPYGLVETAAHFEAAKFFDPKVDFIIDIGGQDIKCFKIKRGAIDSIMLNEACSSGCGSFYQSFAQSLGYDVETFSQLALFADHPVELGSRCTVFMNSQVKQAQKDGATVQDISAGLCKSIVKNALYKVIRFSSPSDLGEHIVVQGGTFLNDAILKAFIDEVGRDVKRPAISGLMGAFGAALYSLRKPVTTPVISKEELEKFSYKTTPLICKGCTAHCNMTLVTFNDGRHFISGNKCEKGEGKKPSDQSLNEVVYLNQRLKEDLKDLPSKPLAKVGLPMGLQYYEFLPFWVTFFKELNFLPVISGPSTREVYFLGQHTIPSDTVCYPAKLIHGHIELLLQKGVDFIFYPSNSYNKDEHKSDNHFNCPVVAYYGELLKKNNKWLNDDNFLDPFIDLNNLKETAKTLQKALQKYDISKKEVYKALEKAQEAYLKYKKDMKDKSLEILKKADEQHKTVICLSGRPYHLDEEINHGIDKLITSLGFALVTEQGLAALVEKKTPTLVLNQWTYHARLYNAAQYALTHKNIELVQLVSFGCGLDAITTDELRDILESGNKFYTQLKIDEISNLGSVKIRLRSLKVALEERHE